MGYRSTIISQDYGFLLPDWFIEKYKEKLNMPKGGLPISSKFERKFYGKENDEMLQDFRIVISGLKDSDYLKKQGIDFALLHEDGAINRITVTANEVNYDDETIGYPL